MLEDLRGVAAEWSCFKGTKNLRWSANAYSQVSMPYSQVKRVPGSTQTQLSLLACFAAGYDVPY
jgi:hypothetical protein